MSGTDTKITKSVQVPTFDGKKIQFGIWWPRFKVYYVTKSVSDALFEIFALTSDPKAVPADNKSLKEYNIKIGKNATCAAAMTLAYTASTLMELVIFLSYTFPGRG